MIWVMVRSFESANGFNLAHGQYEGPEQSAPEMGRAAWPGRQFRTTRADHRRIEDLRVDMIQAHAT